MRRSLVLLLLLAGSAGCGGAGGTAAPAPAAAGELPPELLDVLRGQVDCAAQGLVLVRQHRYDFTGDGIEDALAAVRCDAGAGAPPSSVFAVAATPAGPEVVDELLSAAEGEVVSGLDATGPTAVVTAFGYGPDAPRCCPDLEVVRTYRWDGAAFDGGERAATPLPAAAPD